MAPYRDGREVWGEGPLSLTWGVERWRAFFVAQKGDARDHDGGIAGR